jgi:exodeoxyribonuclease-1
LAGQRRQEQGLNSIFWHDYETFGGDPRRDRPCQFAGIRTDEDLNVIGEPVELYCQPAPDFLPDPVACRITGISPQEALQKGVREAEFCQRILQEFSEPGTCVSGYNSIRFDDEVTRHLLYRCFHDPYEREWKHGNSRWDLIDVLRATRALRPEGINWPDKEDGTPSFRLEELTVANGVAHANAHDALADVEATLAMARLVKQKQPRLYDYLYQLRNKQKVLALLDLARQEPVVHVSGMFPATRGCLGVVMPLLKHPDTNNGIIVVDLLADPAPWLQLSADEIRRKLYTPRAELAEGEERIALKTVHLNRCPVLAPMNVLNADVQQRYGLDLSVVPQHRERVLGARHLAERLREVFRGADHLLETDPDFMLYSGGFFDDHDKRLMQKLHRLPPRELHALGGQFHDARLPELLFRYRARNWPELLEPEAAARWQAFCRERLSGEQPGAGPALPRFTELLAQEAGQLSPELHLQLQQYAQDLAQRYGLA